MESFLNGLQRFGIGRLAAILGVSAGVAAALVALVLRRRRPSPKALLYSNLDLKEAASITQALDQAGIKYEAKGDGSTIMVPRDKVASTRLMLSAKGLPTSGSVGYEIFDNTSALGQTDFVQNLNRQRALEGELARTIRSLDGVTFARVQLVLPKRQLFEDEAEQPSASVVIGVAGREPSPDQVRALQNLVAGAVPNLKPDRVTIVDQNAQAAGRRRRRRRRPARPPTTQRTAIEDTHPQAGQGAGRRRRRPRQGPRAGHRRPRHDQVTTQEEKYDPDGQVVRSTQTIEDNAKQNQPRRPPARPRPRPTSPARPARQHDHQQRLRQRPAPRRPPTTRSPRPPRPPSQQPGTVKRLSVAVAVDGRHRARRERQARRLHAALGRGDAAHRRAGAVGHRLRRRPRRPGQRDQRPLRPTPMTADGAAPSGPSCWTSTRTT